MPHTCRWVQLNLDQMQNCMLGNTSHYIFLLNRRHHARKLLKRVSPLHKPNKMAMSMLTYGSVLYTDRSQIATSKTMREMPVDNVTPCQLLSNIQQHVLLVTEPDKSPCPEKQRNSTAPEWAHSILTYQMRLSCNMKDFQMWHYQDQNTPGWKHNMHQHAPLLKQDILS